MLKVFYATDDLFATEYLYAILTVQFQYGYRWIHDLAQGRRVNNPVYRQCMQIAWHSDTRVEWNSEGLAPQEILPALKANCQMGELELEIFTVDPRLEEQARSLGIPLGGVLDRPVQATAEPDASMVIEMVYAQSALLNEQLSEHLVGRAFQTYNGGIARIRQVLQLGIENCGDGGSAITLTTDGADVRLYYYVKALAVYDASRNGEVCGEDRDEEKASLERFRIWVHALYHRDAEGDRFTLLTAEN